uniref:Glycosyltransferase n=1 Tax=Picrorhiza kurrooa TaxID=195120 RepID=L7QGY2_9LAMI|nr:UDP-glucosyltransferase isoform 1 [Picrorhiza kurrooa]
MVLHAIMIPTSLGPLPFFDLCIEACFKGITVTFVNFDFIQHMISKAGNSNSGDVVLFSKAQQSGLDIRYATISDGLPLEFDRNLNFEEWVQVLLTEFPARVDEFIEKTIKRDPSLISFIVADTYAWQATIANKYNLVSVYFWTEPALVFSLNYHTDLLKEHAHYPCKDDIEEDINYLPGVDSISTRDIMPYLKEIGINNYGVQSYVNGIEAIKNVDFVLHNTVQELEPETLSALNEIQSITPLVPLNFSKNLEKTTITNSLWSESDCTQWLGSKPPGSVLYVSFGSLVQTNKQVVEEIAHGLLLSEVNFIWVSRSGPVSSDDTDVLLNGFEDEIKDRGLIIPWCDQIMVLSNPAIGGFLTHCGWNSILESIWCGVPMICYPVTFDQPTNRKLVVDDWKIGISLCDGTLVNRENVAVKIRNFMHGTSSEGLKREITKVGAILCNATQIGGSSENNFEQFIRDLKAKINTGSSNP